jgi:5-methylcytosine-specific restriction protein A
MPTSPPIACPCGGLKRQGKCDRCGPKGKRSDKQRGTSTQRGYDYRWQRFRIIYLAQHPLCVDCESKGRAGAATDVHHIEKLRDRPDLKYEESNLMGLCTEHHSARTAKGE